MYRLLPSVGRAAKKNYSKVFNGLKLGAKKRAHIGIPEVKAHVYIHTYIPVAYI